MQSLAGAYIGGLALGGRRLHQYTGQCVICAGFGRHEHTAQLYAALKVHLHSPTDSLGQQKVKFLLANLEEILCIQLLRC